MLALLLIAALAGAEAPIESETLAASSHPAVTGTSPPLGDEVLAAFEPAPDTDPIPDSLAELETQVSHKGPGGTGDRVEMAWFAPAPSLSDRASLTRRIGLETGIWNHDAAARSVLDAALGGAEPGERARAALRLAPDLPLARMEMARALWLHDEAPMSALRGVVGAIFAIPSHPIASLWFAGSAFYVAAFALVWGGLLCIGVAGLLASPHAAHDMGDALSGSTPSFARGALFSVILLLPLALGEGLLGVIAVLLLLGCVYGRSPQRRWLAAAAIAVWMGAYPAAHLAGRTLTALRDDPVLAAALVTSHGGAMPSDVARLQAADPDDALAVRAMAEHAYRIDNLGVADARYQQLLALSPEDAAANNNAANVRLNLGHIEAALSLYGESIEAIESPVVLYNLSQAYGRAFQVEDLAASLSLAQQLDPATVAELTALQGTEAKGFVVNLPLTSAQVWRRVLSTREGDEDRFASRGADVAAEFRSVFAPGWLGADAGLAAGVLLGSVLLGSLVGWRIDASGFCGRCGRRVCPRCDQEYQGDEVCWQCRRLFGQTENTDRSQRIERINELRRREARIEKTATATSVLIPGAAGFLAGRPARGLVGALCFALAAASLWWRDGVVPDPLVAGLAAPVAFVGVAVAALAIYAITVVSSLVTRRIA